MELDAQDATDAVVEADDDDLREEIDSFEPVEPSLLSEVAEPTDPACANSRGSPGILSSNGP